MSYYFNKRKARLNAISKSYTEKGKREALQALQAAGINFQEFQKITGYKGSSVRLRHDIEKGTYSTLEKVNAYRKAA